MHQAIRSSFFIKFLVVTSFLIHIYLLLQGIFHTLHFHFMDSVVRWYAFKAAAPYNLGLVVSSIIVLLGLKRIFGRGKQGFRFYFAGKCLLIVSYLLLIYMEYRISGLGFPFILVPVLILLQMIYPTLLYISLHHAERTTIDRV